MAGRGFVQLAYLDFAHKVIKAARLNLGATRKGRRTDSTRRLSNSIDYQIVNGNIAFLMLDYGVFVDAGRDGTKKKNRSSKSIFNLPSNTGRFPNLSAILKWINQKPLRPRNLKTGSFVKKSPKILDQMAYLIGRKIEREGVEPTYFFTKALEQYENELADGVVDGMWEDLINKK